MKTRQKTLLVFVIATALCGLLVTGASAEPAASIRRFMFLPLVLRNSNQ